MSNLIYFLLPTLGASFIWGYEDIFIPVKNFIAKYFGKFRKPFLCPECSSFWIGFVFSLFLNPFIEHVKFIIIGNIFCGLTNFLFFKIIKYYIIK